MKELVKELSKSQKWTEVVIVTRRILDEWKDLLSFFKQINFFC